MLQSTSHLGEPILLEDRLPELGQPLPYFELVNLALESVSLEAFIGQRKILHFHPGIDTPTSVETVQALHHLASQYPNTAVIHISADLPFTLSRFKSSSRINSGHFLSTLRGRDMLKHYGVLMVSSKMAGLPARVLMVADEHHRLMHLEVVSTLTQLPNLARACQVLAAQRQV